MNQQDQKAFDEAVERRKNSGDGAVFEYMFKAGMAHARSGEALFWYRPRSDGGHEGSLHKDSIEAVRKESGAWLPLFTHSQPTQTLEPDYWMEPDGIECGGECMSNEMRKRHIERGSGTYKNYTVKLWKTPQSQPPATQINEQMLAVLKKAYSVGKLFFNPADDFSKLMRETISAAEAAKEQRQ